MLCFSPLIAIIQKSKFAKGLPEDLWFAIGKALQEKEHLLDIGASIVRLRICSKCVWLTLPIPTAVLVFLSLIYRARPTATWMLCSLHRNAQEYAPERSCVCQPTIEWITNQRRGARTRLIGSPIDSERLLLSPVNKCGEFHLRKLPPNLKFLGYFSACGAGRVPRAQETVLVLKSGKWRKAKLDEHSEGSHFYPSKASD